MAAAGCRFENDSIKLIKCFTGFQPDDENFKLCLQYALSVFTHHRFLDVNSHQLQRTIEGLCDKFTVHSLKEKAIAFLSLTRRFLESEVFKNHPQTDVQYSLLALLISLAHSPTDSDYDAQPTLHPLRAGEETRCEWAKLLCEKEVVEPPPTDETSDWSDSGPEELPPHIELRLNKTHERAVPPIEIPHLELSESSNGNTNPCSGRLWLKENLMPQYWNGANVVREPKRVHKCNKLHREWSNYLEDSGVILVKNCGIQLTEYQVIREVLWLLQGNAQSFLTQDRDKYYLFHDIHVSHLTDKSLHDMLSEIIECSRTVMRLDKFVEKTICCRDGSKKCQTLEAYATAVACFLKDFKKEMCLLEERVLKQDSIYLLTNLWTDLLNHLEEIKLINKIHREGVESVGPTTSERAVNLLCVLYENIHVVESLGSGCDSSVELVLHLFLKTFLPYANMIDVWVSEGVLHDPHGEFILERHPEIELEDEQFWSGSITIRKIPTSCRSHLLSLKLMNQLLQAGKSMRLLRRLDKMVDVTSNRSTKSRSFYEEFLNTLSKELNPSDLKNNENESGKSNQELNNQDISEHLRSIDEPDPLLTAHFRRMLDCSDKRKISTDDTSNLISKFRCPFRCPLHYVIQNALSPFIYQKYSNNCSILISTLKKEYNLLTYLSVMRKFFLMEAGDTMFNFYSEVFDKIHDGERWKDAVLLSVLLQDNINVQFPEYANRMCVVLETVSTRTNQPIELLSGIRLHCKIPWPVNIVITSKMQRIYNQIFSFLLQVKWAKYSLDELRFHSLQPERKTTNNNLHNRQQRIYLLRMHLMYFVNNIHNYIMAESLHSTGIELERRLSTACDLEQVVCAHSLYVDQLYQSCLLDNKMTLIRQAILWILNVAVTFRSKWNSGVENFSEDDVSNMEIELKRCFKFLNSFHDKSTKQGSFIEWLYTFVLQDWPTFT